MGVFGIIRGESVRVCEGIFESFVLNKMSIQERFMY